MPVSFYCVSCSKKHTVPDRSICVTKTRNGQPQLIGECPKGKHDVYKFIKQSSYAAAKRKYGSC
jgi:hypothetical protein